jgi:hypothetical protein
MAASLCFGLMTSTVLVLVLVPTFYLLYARMFGVTVDSVTAAEAAVVAKPELLVQQASV